MLVWISLNTEKLVAVIPSSQVTSSGQFRCDPLIFVHTIRPYFVNDDGDDGHDIKGSDVEIKS